MNQTLKIHKKRRQAGVGWVFPKTASKTKKGGVILTIGEK